MLAKKPDALDAPLAALQSLRQGAQPDDLPFIDIGLRDYVGCAKASMAVVKMLEADFTRGSNWLVLHDLTLRVGEHYARIDHLLINRNFDVFILDSALGSSLIKVDGKGAFSRQCPGQTRFVAIDSPLDQMARRMALLNALLPRLLAAVKPGPDSQLRPNVMGFFLLSPGISVVRPGGFGSVDTRSFMPMIQITKELNHYGANSGPMAAAALVSMNQIDNRVLTLLGERLVAMHKPDPVPTVEALRLRYPPPPKVDTPEEAAAKAALAFSCHCGSETFTIRKLRLGGDAVACAECGAAYMLMQLFRCKQRPCGAKTEVTADGKLRVFCEKCQKEKRLNYSEST
ncbi:nuclease-related domain-containing protein [Aquaspirillum soli]|nr:NERD domain-containing protein [Aquaspirillum sp.]